MEIVAAADSDERGLSLLRVVSVLQKVVVFVHSFTINKLRKHTSLGSSAAVTAMPDMREEDITAKVSSALHSLWGMCNVPGLHMPNLTITYMFYPRVFMTS